MEEGKGQSPEAGPPYPHFHPPQKLFSFRKLSGTGGNSRDIANCPFCFVLEIIIEVWKVYKAQKIKNSNYFEKERTLLIVTISRSNGGLEP